MVVFRNSRYAACKAARDELGRRYLFDRQPYRYQSHADNLVHPVVQGDSLWSLAGHYFAPLPRPSGLWWILADFQPEPVVDPLTPLWQDRHHIIVPPLRVVTALVGGSL